MQEATAGLAPLPRLVATISGQLRSIAPRILAVLMLLVVMGFGGSLYAVRHLLATDALYSGLVEREARAMRVVTRAGMLVIDDSRLLLRLVTESDPQARQRLLGERDHNQRRVIETLEDASNLVPRIAPAIQSFVAQFNVLAEKSREVETLVATGQAEAAMDVVRSRRDPLFAELRRQMRGLVQQLEDEMIGASAGATQDSRATYDRILWVVGLGALLSLGLAALLLRRLVTGPMRILEARMRALEAGDVRSSVPGLARRDEIGRMAGAVESFRLAAIRQAILDEQARTDPLTGLLNRRGVDAAVVRLAAQQAPLAAIAIDLDHFKETNDAHGHAAGDALLVAVAARLAEATRVGDVVGRLGGDEFVVVLQDIADEEELRRVAGRISQLLHESVPHGGRLLRLGATLGLGWCEGPCLAPGKLLDEADAALMQAKKRLRGSIGLARA